MLRGFDYKCECPHQLPMESQLLLRAVANPVLMAAISVMAPQWGCLLRSWAFKQKLAGSFNLHNFPSVGLF